MKTLIRTILLFSIFLLSMSVSTTVMGEPHVRLVPDEARIKIDSVDVSQAPEIRIRATLLDPEGKAPVSDDVVFDLFDGNEESAALIKTGLTGNSFFNVDAPLELAVVAPLSARFTEEERQYVVDTLNAIIEISTARAEGLSKEDRFAGLLDTGIEIHDGTTSAKEKDAVLNVLQEAAQFQEHIAKVADDKFVKGQLSFLYSGLEKAIEVLADIDERNRPGYENARRAILVITDGFDSFFYKKDDVEGMINDLAKAAREAGISIYVVMYNPQLKSLSPLFEGLSRKTGGTYREVRKKRSSDLCNTSGTMCTEAKNAYGELMGQFIIDFRHSGLHEGQTVQYKLRARAIQGTETYEDWQEAESYPYSALTVGKLQFNWYAFKIFCFILAGLLVVGLIVFLIMRSYRKKKELEEAAREEQELQEKIEKGEVCPKCHRTMMPDWKECMFCAREAAEEIQNAKAAEKEKAAEEAKKKGEDPNKKKDLVCPNCGRTMMPQWKECMFCKAGIGSDAAPKKGVAPRADKKKEEAPAAEGRICPVCKRAMKPHWTICLYCEADGNNRPATAPAPKQEEAPAAPQASAVRVCPDCGRPMKAHWTVCLYCEANKAR